MLPVLFKPGDRHSINACTPVVHSDLLPCQLQVARLVHLTDQRVSLACPHDPLPTWSPPCTRGSPQRQRLGHCRSNHQSAGAYSPAPARGSHSRRDPFPLTGAFWATSPPPLIETIPRLSPRFLSTVGHSDFSHGIPGDFAGSLLIRPGTRPVERDRTRSPGVTRAPSPPCRPHTPCCVQRPKYFLRPYSAGSVAAGLGRPVSPVSATARRFAANPSDPTSRWAPCPAQASSETAALSLLSVSRHSCAQRGVTPAFGYGPRLGRSGWTLTRKDHAPPGAHYQRVRLPPQHLPPSGWSIRLAYSTNPIKTAVDLPGPSTRPS